MVDAVVGYEGRAVKFCDVQTEDYIEGLLWRGTWFELANLEFIRRLHVSGNYVDVGAYVGTHSIFFSLFCPTERVYSFEPQIGIYTKLVKNLKVNGITNCTPMNVGLSNISGRAAMLCPAGNLGGSQLVDGDEIDVVTLDSLNLQNVKLMKIDAEAAELRVLQGSETTLSGVEHLFVEIWSEEICTQKDIGYTGGEVFEFLNSVGLEFQTEVGTGENLHYFARVQ